jgi:ABC-type glycerol-3-phosphate transport system permease component
MTPVGTARLPRAVPTIIIMAALIAVMVLPFLWMLSTSLKAQEYILQMPPQ